ncbi:MAG: 4-(cytidine 5'-diphospho)-2-C-methyl-D-erythritol kinase [Rhodothermales bacterium]
MPIARSAPAKINLGLHVLRRRPDAYHDLETVFLRIGWADAVQVEPAPDLRFTCSDPTLPADDANLCVRAARALAARAGVAPAARIHLEKRVPYGAGLGGGSSDAAATLRLLDALWNTGLGQADLHALAAGLGSDVPFFLGEPAAFGSGRGEILEPLTDPNGEPYRCPYYLVVVKPDIAVGTADAYRWITPSAAGRPDLRALVAGNDLARWRLELVNDFEKPVFDRYPSLRAIRDGLLADGAGYAAMSGSGSALFGLFPSPESGRLAAIRWEHAGRHVWHGWPDAGDLPG